MKHRSGLFVLLVAALTVASWTTSFSQQAFVDSITVSDGANTRTIYFGADPSALKRIHPADNFFGFQEVGVAPMPVTGVYEVRFVGIQYPDTADFDQGAYVDFRPLVSPTQKDTFRVLFQVSTEGTYPVTVNWRPGLSSVASSMRIVDLFWTEEFGNPFFNQNMLTTTSLQVTSPQIGFLIIFEPAQTQFGAIPSPLSFFDVFVGLDRTELLTVSNTGVAPLTINSAGSTHSDFTVTPTGPVTIAPSGSQQFNVTFTPGSTGPKSGQITFTHWGGTSSVPVSGNGADACPTWTRTYNNTLINGVENMGFAIGTIAKKLHRGLALDAAGNTYECGYSEGGDTSRSLLGKLILTKTKFDFRVVKRDANGSVVWTARYNDPLLNKDEKAYAICVDGAGNVYVAGEKDNGATKIDALVVKFNADGTFGWARTYDGGMGGKKEYAYGIAVDPAGLYVYAAGETDKIASKVDGLAMCLNASTGVIEWADFYNSPSLANAKDYFYDVACDPSGNAVFTGMSEGTYTVGIKVFKTKFDVPVIKYAGGGGSVSRVWEKRYNNSDSIKFVPKNGNDIGYDVEIDSYGNVYVAGCTEWVFKFDMLALKYDPAGNLIARGRYNNYPAGAIAKGGNDIGYSIGYDGSGNMYVAGPSEGGYWDSGLLKFISTKNDMALVKFEATGDTAIVTWKRLYDSGVLPKGTDDIAVDLAVCETGNMVWVTGWGDRGVGFKKDIITLQVDMTTAALGPVGTKNGSNLKDDFGYNVVVRPSECCAVVLGVVDEKLPAPAITTKLDFITMQARAGTALGGPVTAPGAYEGDEIETIPAAFMLYDNYPNPFNPSTTIRMTLSNPSMVSLKVYNVLGQEVAALLDKQEFDAGEQEVVFDARNLASGVYFYRVISETISEDGALGETFMSVKKMLLIK